MAVGLNVLIGAERAGTHAHGRERVGSKWTGIAQWSDAAGHGMGVQFG
jgi:hypothetical protein